MIRDIHPHTHTSHTRTHTSHTHTHTNTHLTHTHTHHTHTHPTHTHTHTHTPPTHPHTPTQTHTHTRTHTSHTHTHKASVSQRKADPPSHRAYISLSSVIGRHMVLLKVVIKALFTAMAAPALYLWASNATAYVYYTQHTHA